MLYLIMANKLEDKEYMKWKLMRKTKIVNNHWLWTGAVINGYGVIGFDGHHYLVNRLSAYIHLGLDLLDTKTQANHRDNLCSHRNCWNPEHLYVGNQYDNRQDMIRDKANFLCGHTRADWNVYIQINSSRATNDKLCKICYKQKQHDYNLKRKARLLSRTQT